MDEFLDETQSQNFWRRLWFFFLVGKKLPRSEQVYGFICRNQLKGMKRNNWSGKVSEEVCYGLS